MTSSNWSLPSTFADLQSDDFNLYFGVFGCELQIDWKLAQHVRILKESERKISHGRESNYASCNRKALNRLVVLT